MTAALAQVVLVAAARAFPALDGADRERAWEAIDELVAAPTAAGCLRATRRLRALGRRARSEASWRRLAERSLGRGLERVRQVPALAAAEAAEMLATLPLDARAGRRLEALAILIEAHQHLAARLREAAAARRALIEVGLTADPPARERRRRRR
jgi:hypothetical protein